MTFCAVRTAAFLTALAALYPVSAYAKADVRAEAQIGWDQLGQSANASTNVLGNEKVSGATYGGNLGYDVPVSPLVSVGVDAGLGGTTAGQGNLPSDRRFQIGRDIYAGARVTLHPLPNLRLYAKVGYANARFTSNIGAHPGQGGKVVLDANNVRDDGGIRAGVGLQYSLIGPVYALAEYRYTRYSEQISRNQIVTGLGLRF